VSAAAAGGWLVPLVTVAIMTPFFWWTMHFLLAGRVRWRTLLPSALITGVFYGGLGVFSKFYFSETIISDSKTYGTIGAIFGIMTWFIAIGAVIILGAAATSPGYAAARPGNRCRSSAEANPGSNSVAVDNGLPVRPRPDRRRFRGSSPPREIQADRHDRHSRPA
jgi:Virulence factor BrkB